MFLLLPSSEPILFKRPISAKYNARKCSQLLLGVRGAQAEALFHARTCLCAAPHNQLHRGGLVGVLSQCPLGGPEDRGPTVPHTPLCSAPERSQASGMFHVLPRGSTEHLGQKVPSSSPPTTVFPAPSPGVTHSVIFQPHRDPGPLPRLLFYCPTSSQRH